MVEKLRRLWDRTFLDYIKDSVMKICACVDDFPGTKKNTGTSK